MAAWAGGIIAFQQLALALQKRVHLDGTGRRDPGIGDSQRRAPSEGTFGGVDRCQPGWECPQPPSPALPSGNPATSMAGLSVGSRM